jgi:hypothetical protein
MAKVYEQEGFRIVIHSNEHNPPHVHVIKAEGELKFILGNESEKPFLEKIYSPMKRKDARRAFVIVKEQQKLLLMRWREIYERQNI